MYAESRLPNIQGVHPAINISVRNIYKSYRTKTGHAVQSGGGVALLSKVAIVGEDVIAGVSRVIRDEGQVGRMHVGTSQGGRRGGERTEVLIWGC